VPIDLGLLVADRKRLMNEAAAAESDRARAAGYLLLIRAAEDLRTAIQAWDRELRIDSFSEAAKEAGDALTNAQRVVLDTAAVPPAGDTTRKRAGR
jgi:hypothetical protein